MKEEIDNIIQEKMEGINPSLTELYSSHESEVQEVVNKQNKVVEDIKKRKQYLALLQEAKSLGMNIDYNENMTTEELESLARSIEV